MFQETEAQKVIAISLGKIAVSRNQRGGPKLFKNLLVANVIQKARYAVWDESTQRYRARHEQRGTECEAQRCDSSTKLQLFPSLSCGVGTENLSLNASNADELVENEFFRPNVMSRDQEVAGTPEMSSDAMEVTNNLTSWDEHNKENVLPNPENPTSDNLCKREAFAGEKLYYSAETSVPSRCIKRRISTSSEECVSHISNKKARVMKTPRYNWRRSDSSPNVDAESDTEDVPSDDVAYRDIIDDQMDLEQISSLVSVFSSSFKGLVDSPKTVSSELTGFYGDKMGRRGTPDVGAVCSKQAGCVFTMRQSSFESTTLPIVALTV